MSSGKDWGKLVETRSERERVLEATYWYSLERGRAGEYFEVWKWGERSEESVIWEGRKRESIQCIIEERMGYNSWEERYFLKRRANSEWGRKVESGSGVKSAKFESRYFLDF
jgi:hypothetical protein